MILGNMAIAYPTEPLILGNLVVADNGLLTHSTGSEAGLTVTVGGDATVESAGSISASGRGYGPSSGPGEGGDALLFRWCGAWWQRREQQLCRRWGAPTGMYWRRPLSVVVAAMVPTAVEAGGAIRLIVAGTCQIDGQLVANGNRSDPLGRRRCRWEYLRHCWNAYGAAGRFRRTEGPRIMVVVAAGAGGRIAVEFDHR